MRHGRWDALALVSLVASGGCGAGPGGNDLGDGGESCFVAHVDYPVGKYPSSVAIGDFNGDGKPDLAVANSGSGDVSVLLNDNGGGTFAPAANYATDSGFGPDFALAVVRIGDLDGDGKADLAVANFGAGNISVLLNRGNGTFAPAVNYAAGTQPSSVAIGDVDGDGRADLVVGDTDGDKIYILLNTGNGTFALPRAYSGISGGVLEVTVGDLDADGKLDVVVANWQSDTVSVLINTGHGTFAAPVPYTTTGLGPVAVAIGDLNLKSPSSIPPTKRT